MDDCKSSAEAGHIEKILDEQIESKSHLSRLLSHANTATGQTLRQIFAVAASVVTILRTSPDEHTDAPVLVSIPVATKLYCLYKLALTGTLGEKPAPSMLGSVASFLDTDYAKALRKYQAREKCYDELHRSLPAAQRASGRDCSQEIQTKALKGYINTVNDLAGEHEQTIDEVFEERPFALKQFLSHSHTAEKLTQTAKAIDTFLKQAPAQASASAPTSAAAAASPA